MTPSCNQFGLYEMLRVYLHDQKLGLLSVNSVTFIAEFGFRSNLVFLIHINIVQKVLGIFSFLFHDTI
jgi:hypothetical protein